MAGLNQADDGGYQALTVTIVDVTKGVEEEVYRAEGVPQIQTTMKAPEDGTHGTTLRFFIRVMDQLGQISDSALQTVSLTQLPNEICFEDDGDTTINRPFAVVGESLPLQVQVFDSAMRPVPDQTVVWIIQSGPQTNYSYMGTTITDINGFSQWNFDTGRASGLYRVKAVISGFASLEAVHSFELMPGDVDNIEFDHVAPIGAGEEFSFHLRALDSANNLVHTENDEVVIIRIEDTGFHFGFAENVTIETLVDNETIIGEQATVRLVNGQANVLVSASGIVGDYSAHIGFDPEANLLARYDHDGNPTTPSIETNVITLTVLPGSPVALQFSEVTKTNDELGVPERLEVGESATIELAVVDGYGNRVTTVEDSQGVRQDANFSVEIGISGSAHSSGASGSVSLTMLRGAVEFPVTDEVVEEVELSVTSISPVPVEFNAEATLTLQFLKKLPAIHTAIFDKAHNDMNPSIIFSYTEPIENAGVVEPLLLSLDATEVTGTIAVSEDQVTFTLDNDVVLNRCYEFDTSGSTWVGVAEQDPVLSQQGIVCSPHIAIPPQPTPYAVEGRSHTLDLVFGPGVDSVAISAGKVFVHGVEADFSWAAGTFVVPSLATTGLVDGEDIILALEGSYLNEDLRVANTISIQVFLLSGDYDADGLPNEVEFDLGLDPRKTDTDGDGLADGNEDTDNDGFTNAEELANGTDPNNPDITPPEVSSVTPANGAGSVALLPRVELVFTEPIKPTTVSAETFTVSTQGIPVSGRFSFEDGNVRVIWTAEEGLDIEATYDLSLTAGIRDVAGNRLVPFTSSFTVTDLALIRPQDGEQVEEGQTIDIEADGSNLAGINSMDYFADGLKVGSVLSPPFVLQYQVPTIAELGDNFLTIGAEAVIGGANETLTASLSASSATYDYAFHPARAADGNRDSDFNHGSVAVVMGDHHAWWEADLGRVIRIENIDIYLMTGCCYESNRFAVLVASEPFVESDFDASDPGGLPEFFSNGAVKIYETTVDYDIDSVSVSGLVAGRYVRIVNLADEFLALTEVEIYEQKVVIPVPEVQVQVNPSGG